MGSTINTSCQLQLHISLRYKSFGSCHLVNRASQNILIYLSRVREATQYFLLFIIYLFIYFLKSILHFEQTFTRYCTYVKNSCGLESKKLCMNTAIAKKLLMVFEKRMKILMVFEKRMKINFNCNLGNHHTKSVTVCK